MDAPPPPSLEDKAGWLGFIASIALYLSYLLWKHIQRATIPRSQKEFERRVEERLDGLSTDMGKLAQRVSRLEGIHEGQSER